MDITTLGIDVGKNVFHVIGTNRAGKPSFKQKLTRQKLSDFIARHPPCLVGMEACGGTHYWARELAGLGHTVRMMAPIFVKPLLENNE